MSQIDKPKLKQMNYEIFVIILTVLSWVNTFLFFKESHKDVKTIILWTQMALAIFFLFDFLYRLNKAESRSQYFKKVGWLDLIGSLPFLQWFRALRVFKTSQYIRNEHGHLLKGFFEARAETAVLTIALAVIFLFEFASIFILRAEDSAKNANIVDAGDAIWWVLVTVSTVGYGDLFPVTANGRLIATLVIVAGVGLFGILSAYLARSFLGKAPSAPESEGSGRVTQREPYEEILVELRDLRDQHTEARKEQDAANKALQERLTAVEKLLESEKIKE
ncbi:MAG: potassium channel family protein [Anaerolineae bacterium]|nr:potassium channel family protein [Anaerolineae bacterium]